jgi:hypothetical protein
MTNPTVKIVALAAIVVVAVAIVVMWKVSSSRNAGPHPGINAPYYGM